MSILFFFSFHSRWLHNITHNRNVLHFKSVCLSSLYIIHPLQAVSVMSNDASQHLTRLCWAIGFIFFSCVFFFCLLILARCQNQCRFSFICCSPRWMWIEFSGNVVVYHIDWYSMTHVTLIPGISFSHSFTFQCWRFLFYLLMAIVFWFSFQMIRFALVMLGAWFKQSNCGYRCAVLWVWEVVH